MRRLIVFIAVSLGFVTSPLQAAAPAPEASDTDVCEGCEALLELALAHPRRAADRARDQYRHPAETLKFFRVRPGMTVVDFLPGGGWYTRILVPYLGKEGRYIAVNPAVTPDMDEGSASFLGGLGEKFPAKAAQWDLEGASIAAFNSDELSEAMNGTVDRVLIIREVHNLARSGTLGDELGRMRDLLKEGGMLGIIDHRAKPSAPADYVTGSKGYMLQSDVIRLVEANGFDLVASSEVNANPRDTADHPGGVWELPPVQSTKREELKSIGESDRMTLLFRKRP